MMLRVGHITYANCAPFFHFLRRAGFEGEIVPGVPAQLNRMLSEGEIDVSPSSSFEYARGWRDYQLLPNLSISSRGPVKSVLLFASRPLEDLEGQAIALTGESATSIHLLEILLREFLGFRSVRLGPSKGPVEETIAAGGNALLIGDRALKAAGTANPECRIYDLGELWKACTGLPFVFALWIIRRDAAREKRSELLQLHSRLLESRKMAFASLENLAAQSVEKEWMEEHKLVDYWKAMSYDLDEEHLAGLMLYFELCVKYRFIPEMPEIRFFK